MNHQQNPSRLETDDRDRAYDANIQKLNEGSLLDKINYVKSIDKSSRMTSDEIVHAIKKHGLDENDGITKEMIENEIGAPVPPKSNNY